MRWFFELLFGAKVDFIVYFDKKTTRPVRAKSFSDARVIAFSEYGLEAVRVEAEQYEDVLRNPSFGVGSNHKKVRVSTNQIVYTKDSSSALTLVDVNKVDTKIISLAWIKEDAKRNKNYTDVEVLS